MWPNWAINIFPIIVQTKDGGRKAFPHLRWREIGSRWLHSLLFPAKWRKLLRECDVTQWEAEARDERDGLGGAGVCGQLNQFTSCSYLSLPINSSFCLRLFELRFLSVATKINYWLLISYPIWLENLWRNSHFFLLSFLHPPTHLFKLSKLRTHGRILVWIIISHIKKWLTIVFIHSTPSLLSSSDSPGLPGPRNEDLTQDAIVVCGFFWFVFGSGHSD